MSVETSSYPPPSGRTQPPSYMSQSKEDVHPDNTVILNKMSISQMRALHSKALRDAEAKQTELRLVLSSRYRELVGSSDEVLAMKGMAEELSMTMEALPESMRVLMAISEQVVPVPESLKEKGRFVRSTTHEDDPVLLTVEMVKHQLSSLPRILHRALDNGTPHLAAVALVRLFAFMKSRFHSTPTTSQNKYPLAQLLGTFDDHSNHNRPSKELLLPIENVNPYELLQLDAQIRMVYLHVQTIPIRIMKLAKTVLLQKATHDVSPSRGALSALALLDIQGNSKDRDTPPNSEQHHHHQSHLASRLLDTYYDSKAKLLHRLLEELSRISNAVHQQTYMKGSSIVSTIASKCETIMSDIVTVIQFDIILHSYDIFCSSTLHSTTSSSSSSSSLPEFDPHAVQQKCSQFLATHIPLLRSQIRNVLVSSVSVDASMLGEIRRSLYDTTTNPAHVSPEVWEKAVDCIVDGRLVSPATYGASTGSSETTSSSPSPLESGLTEGSEEVLSNNTATTQKFSLWSALFSTTFSSLVHDLLSSSFHSVHTSTISTLLQSLSRAPRRPNPSRSNAILYPHPSTNNDMYSKPNSVFTSVSLAFSSANLLLRPHEAHRNTLLIASQLDRSLEKLSEDAHHLLVHAEEREESERRLRHSLYVQTCEIMGRLLSEIRRMIMKVDRLEEEEDVEDEGMEEESNDATKEIIVGRLCHLLQCKRLASLQTLLDPNNAPASTSLASPTGTSEEFTEGALDMNMGIGSLGTIHSRSSTGDRARGMITLDELQSAFEIADDDDDGVISFTEAVEAMGGAFSGTPFNGAEMVRSTLLITSSTGSTSNATKTTSEDTDSNTLQNVTLFELGLLSAKGLRHDAEGSASAMGLIQSCLYTIVQRCFQNWAKIVITPLKFSLKMALEKQWTQGKESSNEEWQRIHRLESRAITKMPTSISSHILAFFLSLSCEMNSAVCPADSIPSVISSKVLTLVEVVRNALLQQSLETFSDVFENKVLAQNDDDLEEETHDEQEIKINLSCSSQILADIRFIQYCYFNNEDDNDEYDSANETLNEVESSLISLMGENTIEEISKSATGKHLAIETANLFLSNLFGKKHHIMESKNNLDSTDIPMGLGTIPTDGNKNSHVLHLSPLESSRRFILLPIQSEKQIDDLELRSALESNNDDVQNENESKDDISGVGKGFGFFSSMLKKK